MADGRSAPASFEVLDIRLASLTDHLFGLWQVSAPSELETVAAESAVALQGEGGQVWTVGLPPAPAAADRSLADREGQMGSVARHLDDLAGNLDEFAALFEQIQRLPVEELPSEAVPMARPELVPEEARMWDALASLRAGVISADWREAAQHLQALLGELSRTVSHFAWVETRSGTRLVGRTSVGWTGDFETLWQADAAPSQFSLHRRSLALALASRDALLHTFVLTAQTVAKLSALVAIPGGFVLALPVIWRFINNVLKDYEAYQALRKTWQGGNNHA
jgi:hypothetical protein